jgi:predicted dehydrogenase
MLRIGVVGVGVWGCHSLEQAFTVTGRARVVAVTTADRWGDRHFSDDPVAYGRAYAARLGAEFVGGWQELVIRPDVDVVSAMVCPLRKAEVLGAALAAGKHVITDKPLAMTAAEVAGVAAVGNASAGRLFMLAGYQDRPLVGTVVGAVQAGRLGRVLSAGVRLCFTGGVFPGFRPSRRWRSEVPSGELTTIGSHALVTLLRVHPQPVTTVRAVLANRFYDEYRQVGAEDWAEVGLRFADGAVGTVLVARLPQRSPVEDFVIDVTGTAGRAHLGPEGLTLWPGEETFRPPLAASFLRDTLTAVADAFERGLPPPVTLADGWRLQAVLDAALASACRGETVPVAWP